MLQYKTVSIPNYPHKGVKKKEFRKGLVVGLSQETCDAAVAPIGQLIEDEARGGWTLHSMETRSQRVLRKRSILEWLFGFIPIIGGFLCKNMYETTIGEQFDMTVLIFVKET